MFKTFRLAALIVLSSLTLVKVGIGQEKEDALTPEKLSKLESVIEVAISPSKEHVAYTLSVPRSLNNEPGSEFRELHVINLKNGETTKLITGEQSAYSIDWTPKGDAVTFRSNLSDASGMQLYKADIVKKQVELLFAFERSIYQYEYINENNIIFRSIEPENPKLKELKEKGFNISVFEEEARHINLYHHDLSSGETRQLTRDVTVFDFTTSPNGKMVAAAVAPQNLVDDSYMFKKIHIINLETGDISLAVDNPGKLGNMAWSPDGKKLAFRSASKLEDSVVGSLFVIDIPNDKEFHQLRNYAHGLEMSIIDVAWKDESTLLFAAEEGVDVILSEQRLNDRSRTKLTQPGDVIFRHFHYVDGLVAFAGNTPTHPSEVYTLSLGKRSKLTRVTNSNEWLKNIKLAKQEKIEYNARDGMRIEGVLLYPLNYEEGKQYPLITYIHGGPEAAIQNGWVTRYSTWGQVASASDYFVFMPNYRASSGRGVDFTMAGYADLVGVEYDDVLDGIDHLIEIGYVDKDKVGMGGGSYGGYFSAWSATKHTDRFAASVVFVGISNQVSKRNTTDIPWEDYHVHWGFWNHENFDKVWDASPIKYAHQSKTPTLILHGTHDPRIHPEQGLQLYRALKLHGQAPVRLVWYHNEGHGNRINLNQYDYLIRTMDWFDHFLKEDKSKDKMPGKYPDYQF
ncbi:MAG: S9 family peptidase [Bacteroidales bacterium]